MRLFSVTSPYKVWLFLKRGFVMTTSYRTALVIGLLSSFGSFIQFGIMANFLSQGNSFPLLAPYGGDLLAFLIIGHLFNVFVGLALNGFQQNIRQEQQMGTLEYLLMGELPLALVVLYAGLWNFVNMLFNATLVLGFVAIVFRPTLVANVLASGLIFTLAITALSGIGLASSGVIIITKQGDPITWVFTTLSALLSGVLFPVEYLPESLQRVAFLLPTTHALRGLRLSLIRGAGVHELGSELIFLAASCLVTIPAGLLIFTWGMNRARQAGSLTHY